MRKKMLFLGVDTTTHDALGIAKELGLYTIVTDYNTPEDKPEKAEADEYWMINVADTETIYQKCVEEHVDCMFAGAHEFCLDKAEELCARLGLPFYASKDGWRCARDKVYFKEVCEACGLDTPKTYMTEGSLEGVDLSGATYPLMVKPSDSCASQGISVCNSAEELPRAYEYALEASKNKKIIIEEYVTGDELAADFIVLDHKPYLVNLSTMVKTSVDDKMMYILSLQTTPHYNDFVSKCMDKLEKFMRLLDWKDGPCFLQAIERDGRYYFLEFGGRLTGIGAWAYEEHYYKMSKLRAALMLAAEIPVGPEVIRSISRSVYYAMIYMPRIRAGRIAEISGIDEVKKMHGIQLILKRYRPGDEVQMSNSMFGMAYYISVAADSLEDLCSKVRDMNAKLSIKSTEGAEMLIKYEDFDELRSYYG